MLHIGLFGIINHISAERLALSDDRLRSSDKRGHYLFSVDVIFTYNALVIAVGDNCAEHPDDGYAHARRNVFGYVIVIICDVNLRKRDYVLFRLVVMRLLAYGKSRKEKRQQRKRDYRYIEKYEFLFHFNIYPTPLTVEISVAEFSRILRRSPICTSSVRVSP